MKQDKKKQKIGATAEEPKKEKKDFWTLAAVLLGLAALAKGK